MKHQINLTRNLGRVLDQYVEARITSVALQSWIPSRTVDLTGTARVLLSKLAPLSTARRNIRTTQIAVSDGEIATNLLIVEHMQLLGSLAHLFDRDQIEIGKKTFASPAHSRIDDPLQQDRVCG